MEKQTIVDMTLAAANAMLASLEKDEIIEDKETLNKWSEALLRYVFYHTDDRTHGQDIENLVKELLNMDLTPYSDDIEQATQNLQQIILDIQERAADEDDLSSNIVWEPIFDRGMMK